MPERPARHTAESSRFHIAASADVMEPRPRVLKFGDTFGVFDLKGDVCAHDHAAEGIFHEDTRHLSDIEMRVAGGWLMLLGSTVMTEEAMLAVDLANPDIFHSGELVVPRERLHALRTKTLGDGSCFERVRFHNYGDQPIVLPLAFTFAADFADIFEVRGQKRPKHGRHLPDELSADGVEMAYDGLDGIRRKTRIRFKPAPRLLAEGIAHYELKLGPAESWTVEIEIALDSGRPPPARHIKAPRLSDARIATSNDLFNEWIQRSRFDLEMLTTETPQGVYPYAGIPWFSTPFGRDGIITALQRLWLDPGLARGVLGFLAATQAKEEDPANDAEPGKILHEMRKGEMAALREVPFGRYYGTVDATPLFVMLAGAYFQRTGDLEFIRSIWPNIEAALTWMERYGDSDGDGFIEYQRHTAEGLANQGWKDSEDSIFHADGTLAQGPIALCEVQGYAYAARMAAVRLVRALDDRAQARALFEQAMQLRERFEEAFWIEELGTYALALDGNKRPCKVATSNAGHALYCGIARKERARRVAASLMSEAGFSGWGIRTVAMGAARYNPMSYHNGSVWPHDNGLIGLGFARYGLKPPLLEILGGMFDATICIDLRRLPELFCGFARRAGAGPTAYPVACAPQAWSSSTAFALVGACLGVSFDPQHRQIKFDRPVLPDFIDELRVSNLHLGDSRVEVLFRRHVNDVAVNVVRREGDAEIIVTS